MARSGKLRQLDRERHAPAVSRSPAFTKNQSTNAQTAAKSLSAEAAAQRRGDRRSRSRGRTCAIRRPAAAASLRSTPASRSRVIRPSRTSEILPSSSDTTITTASVSSVRPIAARWRVPSVLLTFGLVVSGRRQPGGYDPALVHDHRAVVHRRRRQEDAQQELLGDLRVEARAALDVLVQADLALDARSARRRAGPASSTRARVISSIACALRETLHAAEERARADLGQHAADVVLEDDHDHESRSRCRAESSIQLTRVELEVLRRPDTPPRARSGRSASAPRACRGSTASAGRRGTRRSGCRARPASGNR